MNEIKEKERSVSFSNKQLYRLLLPLIVEQFLAITVGIADSMMVASVGEAAVSAVSLVDSVNNLVFFTFSALATGGAVVCGQYIGSRELERANTSVRQLLIFIVALAIVIEAALYLAKPLILHKVFGSIEADVMAYADTYFVIVEASVLFIALYNAGAAIFRVMGNSSVSMGISIVMNVINVGGNALLIFGWHMGVEGVAIPTLVSRILGAIAVLWLLNNDKYILHLSRPFSLRLEWGIIKNILKVGVPSGVENSLFQLGKVLLLSVVSSFGTASIAANAICNAIAIFHILPAQAIGVGMITVVSQCVGARDFQGARKYTRKLMKWAYVSTLIFNVILALALPLFIRLYNVSDEASHMATIILLIHGVVSVVIWPLAFTLPQALKAAGDTTFVMVVAVVSMWAFRIFAGVWLSKYMGMGLFGVWIAMFVDWTVRLIIFVVRYRGDAWQNKFVQ